MLRPLGEALGRWTPGKGAGPSDPLVLLAAGWREIVGDDVARNSHPARILDDALWVTTRSSAWSQQLSFLADQVLAAVRVRLPQTPVSRLRFRVGKIPVAVTRGVFVRSGPLPPPVAARRPDAPPTDAAQALARFRDAVNERRRANRRAGWKDCQGCGAPVASSRDAVCAICLNARSQRQAATAARLMFEAPWLGYAGTADLIEGLTPADYEAIRTRLLSRWWDALVRARAAKRVSRDGHERAIASSYVLLKSKLPPEVIDPATLRNVLGDELNDLLFGTERQTKTDV